MHDINTCRIKTPKSISPCQEHELAISTLRTRLHEMRVIDNTLETELQWAMECKLRAEMVLAEESRGLTTPTKDTSSRLQLPMYTLEQCMEITPERNQSHSSLFSKPCSSNNLFENVCCNSVFFCRKCRTELAEAKPDATRHDAEDELSRLTTPFRSFAEKYNEVVRQLQDAQNNVYYLRKQNAKLQASNKDLLEYLHILENRMQKLIREKSLNLDFYNLCIAENRLDGVQVTPGQDAIENVYQSTSINDSVNYVTMEEDTEQGGLETLHVTSNSQLPQNLSLISSQGGEDFTTSSGKGIKKDIFASLKRNIPGAATYYSTSPTSVLGLGTPKKNPSKNWASVELGSPQNLSPMFSNCLSFQTTGVSPRNVETSNLLLSDERYLKSGNRSPNFPKSISIRAKSLMGLNGNPMHCLRKKAVLLNQGCVASRTLSPIRPHRLRLSSPSAKDTSCPSHDTKAKYHVDQLEWTEAFDQGTYKTELCNKWQEQGTCPYGDRCQFAHGVEELRPILRHPRYKTELCRMVAAGELCPYRHRCHYRHVLNEEEKLALSPMFSEDIF